MGPAIARSPLSGASPARTAQLADLGIADVELAIGALNDPVIGPDILTSAGARTCHWHKSVPPVVCRTDGLHRNLLARPRIGATISRDYPAWNGCFGGRRRVAPLDSSGLRQSLHSSHLETSIV